MITEPFLFGIEWDRKGWLESRSDLTGTDVGLFAAEKEETGSSSFKGF